MSRSVYPTLILIVILGSVSFPLGNMFGMVQLIMNFIVKPALGRKEMFYITEHSTHFFTVIWCHTYGKGAFR